MKGKLIKKRNSCVTEPGPRKGLYMISGNIEAKGEM